MLIFRDAILRKKIIRVSTPAMLEMSLYMLIGVADIAIVGRLGAAPLAAVGLGAEIFFSLVLLFEALAVGASVVVAQAKGANNIDRMVKTGVNTALLALIFGAIPFLIGLLGLDVILSIFKLEPIVYADTRKYLFITFQFAPIAVFVYMINAYFRGLGRTEIPMYVALAINIVNIVGDYLLVYGKFGFPKLGVAGAAWATSFAHVVGLFILFIILLIYAHKHKLFTYFHIEWALIKNILSVGIPSFIEHFFWTISNFISIFLIVYMGTVAYAAHQLGLTVESISYMPGFGMAIAATALVGQAVGANDKLSVEKAARGTIEAALLMMGVFGLLFMIFPTFIAKLFTNDTEVIKLAALLIRIAAFEQLSIAASMVLGGILKGAGDTKTPMLISTIFTWGFRLPLLYLSIFILSFPIYYIWFIFILDWLLRTITFITIYRRKKWLNKALNLPKEA